MSSTQPLPPKKEVALALLERSSVYVHLDPRQNAVVVPPWFKKQAQLVLQIGLNMPMPIPDLRLDDDGMSCTLSFNRSPFFCVVPWASVFAMVGEDGRGMVWPDDVPAEVARQAQVRAVDTVVRKDAPSKPVLEKVEKEAKPPEMAKPKRARKRAPLAAVPDGDGQAKKSAKRAPSADRGAQAQAGAARPVVAPAPMVRPASNGSRKKRELPPYLRVVK
jgi:stringent starvation protein B